ncbi:hypothetical protein QR680_002335 [Steinernema hermaphroditum]|uniref:EGF-like domain-containing protein n=1 Tax=Steinernema hermaphroditum TaxID=289476 RepID=A0AA39H382_9BILA|nr:hypothetical protein QR680_002335 [Steinernema hermaphroditum]
MFSAVLFCVLLNYAWGDLPSSPVVFRVKRQNGPVYLCGTYPNQYYSYYPCYIEQNKCPNGGDMLGIGCIHSAQCTPHYNGVTTCISGCCCTVPNTVPPNPPQPPVGAYGFCYDGQRSNVRCSAADQCPTGQSCMNGLCCGLTNEESRYACGGQLSLGSCSNEGCDKGYQCTASNYCCECPVGQSGGQCTNGRTCPRGFTCQPNGYCCASCPDNRTPFGACRPGGVCGGSARCMPGNICC